LTCGIQRTTAGIGQPTIEGQSSQGEVGSLLRRLAHVELVVLICIGVLASVDNVVKTSKLMRPTFLGCMKLPDWKAGGGSHPTGPYGVALLHTECIINDVLLLSASES
jgi:hypothetical protein